MMTTTTLKHVKAGEVSDLLKGLHFDPKQILDIQITPIPNQTKNKRIPEMHKGAIEISDDFDEPLPDEFWMGTS